VITHTPATLARVTTVLHLAAPNDRNGNPRRAYVAFEGSALRGFWPEGYQGPYAVPPALRDLAQAAPRINVTVTELRRWQRWAAALDSSLCGA
jgi:hypothetical protein